MAIDINALQWKSYSVRDGRTGYGSGYLVYRHTNINNGKVYIGITKHIDYPNSRWRDGKGYYNSKRFFASILKYGWEAFNHDILLVSSFKEACKVERELVLYYKELGISYNIENGGVGVGAKAEETIRKLASYTPWIKGKHHTKEARRKISEAGRGRPMSEDTRLKLIESNRKRPHIVSKETKEKIQLAQGRPVLQIDRKTGEVVAEYVSARTAELALCGRFCGHVSEVCLGKPKRHTYCGFKWMYKI